MITVRVRGRFVTHSFHTALAQLRVRHPLLALRVGAPHFFGAYWLSDGVPDFSVRVVEACVRARRFDELRGQSDNVGLEQRDARVIGDGLGSARLMSIRRRHRGVLIWTMEDSVDP